MLSLKTKHLEAIKRILLEQIPESEVWAYGSRVSENAHHGSDLDLVVINPLNPSLPEVKISSLRELFNESNIPILIDIHDWATLPESFRNEIKKKHIPIQTPKVKK